jgi:hypothetical protein
MRKAVERQSDVRTAKGNPPRAVSVDSSITKTFVSVSQNIQVRLLISGEQKRRITVSENISREELRKRAS